MYVNRRVGYYTVSIQDYLKCPAVLAHIKLPAVQQSHRRRGRAVTSHATPVRLIELVTMPYTAVLAESEGAGSEKHGDLMCYACPCYSHLLC